MSRIGSLENPDYMLIDLDPQDCPYSKIVEAALLVRTKLDKAELESFPKTTGGDGMHLFVPLAPEYTYEQVRSFAELLSVMVASERPDLFTTPRGRVEAREGQGLLRLATDRGRQDHLSPLRRESLPRRPRRDPVEMGRSNPASPSEPIHHSQCCPPLRPPRRHLRRRA